MWPMDCIAHKRDGKVLTADEIRRFIADYTAGRIADYQAAAWLMAKVNSVVSSSVMPWR